MKRAILGIFVALAGMSCVSAREDGLFREIEMLSPIPFTLDEGFMGQFIRQTGYGKDILLTRLGLFRTERYVYIYFRCSANLEVEDDKYTDHRNFICRRKAGCNSWSDMDVFFLPDKFTTGLAGFESDDLVNILIADYGRPVSPDLVRAELRAILGE